MKPHELLLRGACLYQKERPIPSHTSLDFRILTMNFGILILRVCFWIFGCLFVFTPFVIIFLFTYYNYHVSLM